MGGEHLHALHAIRFCDNAERRCLIIRIFRQVADNARTPSERTGAWDAEQLSPSMPALFRKNCRPFEKIEP